MPCLKSSPVTYNQVWLSYAVHRSGHNSSKVPPQLSMMFMEAAHTLKPSLQVSSFLWLHERFFFSSVFSVSVLFFEHTRSNPPAALLDLHARSLQLSPSHPGNSSMWVFFRANKDAIRVKEEGSLYTLTPWNPGIPSYPMSPLVPLEEAVMLVRDRWQRKLSNLFEG